LVQLLFFLRGSHVQFRRTGVLTVLRWAQFGPSLDTRATSVAAGPPKLEATPGRSPSSGGGGGGVTVQRGRRRQTAQQLQRSGGDAVAERKRSADAAVRREKSTARTP
jgi:hypothetical protein